MKDILQSKVFWTILIILLLAVFIYPPFINKSPSKYVVERSWGCFFSPPKIYPLGDRHIYMELDLKTLFVEAIIAILLTVGIYLIPFRKIGILIGFISSGIKESKTNHEDT